MRLTSTLVLAALALSAADTKASAAVPHAVKYESCSGDPTSDGAQLRVPQGFAVQEFASALEKPRIMLQAPGGEILVSEYIPNGRVSVLTDNDKDGKADPQRKVLIENLDRPYGLAFWKNYLYVAEATSLKRYKFDAKAVSVDTGEEIISLKDYGKGHVTRTIAFDSKGQHLYHRHRFGNELRSRRSGEARRYLEVQSGRNGLRTLRDRTPKSHVDLLLSRNEYAMGHGSGTRWSRRRPGSGFLHTHPGRRLLRMALRVLRPNEDPRNKGQRPDLVKKTIAPDMSLGAHTAVIDWKFYNAKRFPAKYQGGAFFALHGSSNREKRVGYSVVFVPFKNGKPSGPIEDFLTGFMLDADKREVWGRPTGVTVLNDGNMLVSEDGGNRIFKVTYTR